MLFNTLHFTVTALYLVVRQVEKYICSKKTKIEDVIAEAQRKVEDAKSAFIAGPFSIPTESLATLLLNLTMLRD
jgi:hypothetical protein